MKKTVFINTSFDAGWIIEKLAAELKCAFERLGVPTNLGLEADYQNEPVVFQTKYLYAKAFPNALINAALVTHIDDRLKEMETHGLKKYINSFVCMSPEDAAFLVSFGISERTVIGLDLPMFDGKLDPIKIAIFSRRYADGRKNELWLLDWARTNLSCRKGIYFCLIGAGWFSVGAQLEEMGWSVEILSLSNELSQEYEIQLQTLRSADAYLYMGFDGGALGSYDAFKIGVPMFVSSTSYHHSIPGVQGMFNNEKEFQEILHRFALEWGIRKRFVEDRAIPKYAVRLLSHWDTQARLINSSNSLFPGCDQLQSTTLRESEVDVKDAKLLYRIHYQSLSLFRVLGTIKRIVRRHL